FLGQVPSADHSCHAPVARRIVHRVLQGPPSCGAETEACSQARNRLPLPFFAAVARRVGQTRHARVTRPRRYPASADVAAPRRAHRKRLRTENGRSHPVSRVPRKTLAIVPIAGRFFRPSHTECQTGVVYFTILTMRELTLIGSSRRVTKSQ